MEREIGCEARRAGHCDLSPQESKSDTRKKAAAFAGAEGARIDRSGIRLRLLSAPLTGARFFAAECPFNHQEETL